MNRSALSSAIISALLLAACGGGGGGGGNVVRPSDPPPPTAPPPPTTCTDSNATNNGGPLPCTYRYSGLADNLLVPANVDQARAAGFNGAGVRVGLLDDAQYDYAPLTGQVASYKDYTGQGPEPTTNAQRGHGTMMAGIIAGLPGTGFKGGVAPGASIVWGRTCFNNSCSTVQAGQAFAEMTAAGVRIFNYSIGSYLEGTQAQQAASTFAFYAKPVIDANGLIVASTGNDAKPNPTNPAGAPAFDASLRNNVLAVANVLIDSAGKPGSLAASSNQCGTAADWCLVAPGRLSLPALAGTDFTNGVDGTSASTALVTGVAALTQQAFPWMTGHNLQQTLLTTSTDLGAAGVDAVFGWGMVNAAKAVKGPGQFIGQFNANVTGTSEFQNDITGTGSLLKRGAGTLVLGGVNSYTGGTTVQGGTLGIKGSVGGNVLASDGGTVQGMGGKIGGDYAATTGATTAIELGKPFNVDGAANLAGSLLLLPEASGYTVQATETLLRAGSVNGTFGSVRYGNNFFWNVAVTYGPTTVTGATSRASAQTVAAGGPASLVDGARQIDVLVDALDRRFVAGDTQGLAALYGSVASLINANDAQVASALPTLTGEVIGAARTTAVQASINDSRIAADRLPLLAGTEQETTWVQVDAVDGTLERVGYSNADYRQSGITVGIDIPVGRAVLGASVGKGRTKADMDSLSGEFESDRFSVNGYGYLPIGKAYLSAVVGIDSTDIETTRAISNGTSVEIIRDDRTGSGAHARIEAGAKLGNGIAPFAAVGIVHNTQDAFSEASPSGLGLSAGQDSVDATYADLGVRFDKGLGAWEIGSLLAYRNVFAGGDTDFNAFFTGMEDARFTINGQPVARDAVRALFTAGYRFGNAGLLYGSAGYETNGDQGDSATVNLGLRWAF